MTPAFSLTEFLEWARTKPADERYDYDSLSNCALCQFLKANGYAEQPIVDMESEGRATWCDMFGPPHQYEVAIDEAVRGSPLNGQGFDESLWTFGALVARLEKLVSKQVIPSDWTRVDVYLTGEVTA